MRRLRIAPALAGAGLVAVLVLVPAAPAYAASASITLSAPTVGTTYQSTSVAVTGSAGINTAALETNYLTDLAVAVSFEGSPAGSCDDAGCGATVGATTNATTAFSYTPPTMARNGPYSVTAAVSAKECNLGGLLGCNVRTNSASAAFAIAVAPVAPRNVKAVVNGDDSVTVSWQANPEPDVIGYQVQRQASGGATLVGNTEGTSVTDSAATLKSGGQFQYVVTAFRPGADGTAHTVLYTSANAAAADVPVPVTTTVTTTPGAPGGVSTTTTVPVTITLPPGGANIASFLIQAQAAGALPVVPKAIHTPAPSGHITSSGSSGAFPSLAAPGPPNTYAPTLPYTGSAPLTAKAGSTAGSRVPLAGAASSGGGSGNHSLVYSIAGGLLLFLLGVGLHIANKRSGAEPLEPLDRDSTGAHAAHAAVAQGTSVVVVPASVAAKAAARAAARKAWADANGDILAGATGSRGEAVYAGGVGGADVFAGAGAGAGAAANGGNVSGGNVSGGNVSGGNVSGGNVSGGNVSGGNVNGGSVNGGGGYGGANGNGSGVNGSGLLNSVNSGGTAGSWNGGGPLNGVNGSAGAPGMGVAGGGMGTARAGAAVAPSVSGAPPETSRRMRRRRGEPAIVGQLQPQPMDPASDPAFPRVVPFRGPGPVGSAASAGGPPPGPVDAAVLVAVPESSSVAPAPPPAPVEPAAANGKRLSADTASDINLAAHPSVEEAVDYFRLIRSIQAPADPAATVADPVEVTAPAG